MGSEPLRRGDIVRLKLDPVIGSEQAGARPALIVSPGFINERAPIVLIAPITSKKTDRVYPFEALIEPSEGGLTQRSKVLLLHMRGIDKRRIFDTLGSIDGETLARVETAIRIATGLTDLV